MLPAFNEKHSDRNTAVRLRHASQPNGDAQQHVTDEERTLWIRFKTCWTSKLPAVFAAFGTTSSSLNSDQTTQGWLHCGPRGQWLVPTLVMPGQHHQAQPATGHCHTNSWWHFFFFLRHCSSDFRKPSQRKIHQSNKKRHKLASSDGLEKLQLTPRLTFLFCPVFFFKVSSNSAPH